MKLFSSPSVYVIAEAGVNHNGSFDTAIKLIDAAVDAGADAVKFQSFIPELLVTRSAPKAQYQVRTTGNRDSQLDMLRTLSLTFEQQEKLFLYCVENDIDFLSTPFDMQSQHFLCDTLNLPVIKIGSGDVTNGPLILAIAEAQKAMILSSGMCDLNDIRQALQVAAFGYTRGRCEQPEQHTFERAYASENGQSALKQNVFLLQCTTEYPCPFEDVNLLAMDALRETFQLPVGLSDHSSGISVPLAAVARGARIIEKHFTLDRAMSGPDHIASLEPTELKQMIVGIREVELALGDGSKQSSATETKNQSAARKYLVAARPIKQGEYFSPDNVTAKRIGQGLSPMLFWDLTRQKAQRDYDTDEAIEA